MLWQTNLRNLLTTADVMALLVGSVSHDVDHPGTNNTFHINTRSDIAFKYHDQSVLENHHLHITFSLLREPETNFWTNDDDDEEGGNHKSGNIGDANAGAGAGAGAAAGAVGDDNDEDEASKDGSGCSGRKGEAGSMKGTISAPVTKKEPFNYSSFRNAIVGAILSTDMSKHFQLVEHVDLFTEEFGNLELGNRKHTQFVINFATHLGNSTHLCVYALRVRCQQELNVYAISVCVYSSYIHSRRLYCTSARGL